MAHLHDLVEGVGTINSSTTGVDYNDDDDHDNDDAMTTSLVFEPQEFVRPPSKQIAIFGADYKAKSGCG